MNPTSPQDDSPRQPSFLTALDREKAELEKRHPGWQVWFVPNLNRTVTWCARRQPQLTAASAEDLSEAIGRTEAGQ